MESEFPQADTQNSTFTKAFQITHNYLINPSKLLQQFSEMKILSSNDDINYGNQL